jgi:glycosyltransferase involved in cell wall biosynthesis
MQKQKLLIVSRSFYPQNSPRSFRTTELAKEFTRQGHDLTVMIPNLTEEQIKFAKQHKFIIKNLGKFSNKMPDFGNSRIGYFFTRAIVRFFQLGFEYPDIKLMFLVKKALKKASGYDLLISIAVPYPIHWGVAWARTKKNQIAKTWVADCGDPYMMSQFDTFKKVFYFKYFEKWFSKKADFISIPRIEMINNFYSEFHEKIRGIPQGFNFSEIETYAGTFNNQVPTFAYAGTFIKVGRNPEALLKYLANLRIDFKFIVYTKTAQYLDPFKAQLGNKLELRSYIPREKLIFELSKMDFLINISYDPTNQAPSKLIDYYLTGRPVLSLPSNQIDEKKFMQFLNGNYSSQFIFENIDNYRIENVCNQFISLLSEN